MNTASIAERRLTPTVPLLGANGWIVAPAVAEQPVGLVALVRAWLRRSRTRNDLAELDERLLRDIGLTRSDVVAESTKHFWQP